MSQKYLISVIIPFLNAGKFIEEAIESVFDQTETQWELLLVDDGSSDRSTQIALDYAERYPEKVYYFEHDQDINCGSSATRNLGIKNAKGNYITLLDADDIWLPSKLREQVEIMESTPEAGMVYGNTKYWYSWNGDQNDKNKDFYLHDKIQNASLKLNTVIYPPTLLTLALESTIWVASMSNIMIRREALREVRGFEENFTGMHDDQAFLAKICLVSPVYVADTCWDLYRQHSESCYNVAVEKGLWVPTELYYLDWLNDYLRKKKIKNPELLRALHERRWKYRHPNLHKLNAYKSKIVRKIIRTAKLLSGRL